MKKLTIALLSIISSLSFSQQKKGNKEVLFLSKNKTIVVYTSADSTTLRISKTDSLSFSELKQPLET